MKLNVFSNIKNSKKSSLGLSSLVLAWILVSGSSQVHAASMVESSPNTIFFYDHKGIFEIDPSQPELVARELYRSDKYFYDTLHVSSDKRYVYHMGYPYQKIDLVNQTIEGLYPYNMRASHFVLKKPDTNSMYYLTWVGDDLRIGEWDINRSRRIATYSHHCTSNDFPVFLDQTSDGSKLLYKCIATDTVYMKDIPPPSDSESTEEIYHNADDIYLFGTPHLSKLILTPDGSKAVIYNQYRRELIIKDMHTFESKPIILSRTLNNAKLSFSNNGQTLYILNHHIGPDLSEIDFQSMLNSSGPNFDIGSGRRILLPAEHHNGPLLHGDGFEEMQTVDSESESEESSSFEDATEEPEIENSKEHNNDEDTESRW